MGDGRRLQSVDAWTRRRPRSRAAALETRQYTTLEEYSQATKQDQHSVLVDYDIFMNVPKLDAQDVATVQKVYKAESSTSG